MENIVVMFGGKSFEHDVSIISGLQVMNNLNKFKYKIFPVYITRDGDYLYSESLKDLNSFKNFDSKKHKKVYFKPNSQYLWIGETFSRKLCKINAVVLATHGGNGEDGTISAVLDEAKLPYTASGLAASALCMDKTLTKYVLSATDIANLSYAVLRKQELTEVDVSLLPEFPLVIKPARLGSSIGVKKVNNEEELAKALEVAFALDDTVIVEKALTNFYELNIALYGGRGEIEVSQIEKPIASGDVLTFENKYISEKNSGEGGMQNLKREFPADISKELEDQVVEVAKKAYRAFGLSGICRIDFLVDADDGDKLYLNEINTIPGSLAFYLFKNKFTFTELLDELIENAKLNALLKNVKKFNFESSILDNVDFGGTKK